MDNPAYDHVFLYLHLGMKLLKNIIIIVVDWHVLWKCRIQTLETDMEDIDNPP